MRSKMPLACCLESSLVFVLKEMRFLIATRRFPGFERCFAGSKFDSNWIGRRVIGVWSMVRVPPATTLANGKVKKHPLEYGLPKVFSRTASLVAPPVAISGRLQRAVVLPRRFALRRTDGSVGATERRARRQGEDRKSQARPDHRHAMRLSVPAGIPSATFAAPALADRRTAASPRREVPAPAAFFPLG